MSSDMKVCVVDNDKSSRESIKWLLESVEIDALMYESATQYLEALPELPLHSIVLDVRLPVISGIELQRKMKQEHDNIPIIFISSYDDIRLTAKTMKNGAFDFFSKPFNDNEFIDSVQKSLIDAKNQLDKFKVVDDLKVRLLRLTKAERRVLDKLVDGKANKVIASELSLSIKTVEFHRSNILNKMELKAVSSLIKAMALINLE